MWRIACTGTIEGVRDTVREATCYVDADRPSFERAQAFLLAELDGVPTNGVMVEVEFGPGTMRLLIEDVPLVLTPEATRPRTKAIETLESESSNATLAFATAHLYGRDGASVRPSTPAPRRPLERQETR